MVRIALVNPPALASSIDYAVPPLGLGSIASSLRAAGFSCDLFDFVDLRRFGVAEAAAHELQAYGIVGLTSYTETLPSTLEVASAVRMLNGDAVVVVGGPHASACGPELLSCHPAIDFVVRGEGERPMVALAEHLVRGAPLGHVPGLTFRRRWRDPSSAVATTPRSEPPPVDALPWPARDFRREPDRNVLERRRHDDPVRIVFLSTSRGCPHRCSFCAIGAISPTYRTRSIASIMGELRASAEARPFGHVSILDANFFADADRAEAFARALLEWDPAVTWSATATAGSIVRHAGAVRRVGAWNCLSLEIGIESGNAAALTRFRKTSSVATNARAVSIVREAGIEILVDFIMFDPETTLDDLRANLVFLRETELTGTFPPEYLYNTLTLYPGTAASQRYADRLLASDPLHARFDDARTAWVHREFTLFAMHLLPRMQRATRLLDAAHRSLIRLGSPAHARLGQALASCAIRLSHAPQHILEELVERAALGVTQECCGVESARSIRRARQLLRQARSLLDEVP